MDCEGKWRANAVGGTAAEGAPKWNINFHLLIDHLESPDETIAKSAVPIDIFEKKSKSST